jgi:hypothetical protein
MSAPRTLAALVVVAVLGVAGFAHAAGPLDGAYLLTATGTDMDPVTLVFVVTQNDSQIGIALLDPLDSSWTYLIAGLSADQRVDGPLLFGDGLQAGSVSVRFQESIVTGSVTLFEVQFNVTGSKMLF